MERSRWMKLRHVAEDQVNVAVDHQERISALLFIREMMMPSITKYTRTGSFYYTDDWFPIPLFLFVVITWCH